jgi:hypothetical protein
LRASTACSQGEDVAAGVNAHAPPPPLQRAAVAASGETVNGVAAPACIAAALPSKRREVRGVLVSRAMHEGIYTPPAAEPEGFFKESNAVQQP